MPLIIYFYGGFRGRGCQDSPPDQSENFMDIFDSTYLFATFYLYKLVKMFMFLQNIILALSECKKKSRTPLIVKSLLGYSGVNVG